jgi:exosortase K
VKMKRISKMRVIPLMHPTRVINDSIFYTLGGLIALALKYHYSRAGADDLAWVLTPTASLVEVLTGIPFENEAHAGFISREQGIIIAPACAGINFLIMAFASLCFTNLGRMKTTAGRLVWLGLAAGICYLVTLGVNALRISVAVVLYHADIYGGWITPERVHRIAGTLIYCFCLLVLHLAGERIAGWLRRRGAEPGKVTTLKTPGFAPFLFTCAVPLLWYALVTIGIPLMNRAYRQSGLRFVEHCALVLVACGMVVLLFFLIRLGCYKVGSMVRKLSTGIHSKALRNTWWQTQRTRGANARARGAPLWISLRGLGAPRGEFFSSRKGKEPGETI